MFALPQDNGHIRIKMQQYQLAIRQHNIAPHLDIEKDIEERRNGLFTFTLRVNNSNIVDYNVTDYINVKQKYGIIKALIIEEITIELAAPSDSI